MAPGSYLGSLVLSARPFEQPVTLTLFFSYSLRSNTKRGNPHCYQSYTNFQHMSAGRGGFLNGQLLVKSGPLANIRGGTSYLRKNTCLPLFLSGLNIRILVIVLIFELNSCPAIRKYQCHRLTWRK